MWTWDQSEGALSQDGKHVSSGYSGSGRGKNNPSMQAAVGVGPIPAGMWVITDMRNSPNTGPCTLDLVPATGTDTEGRTLFRIHGDSIADPGNASHGCIVLPLMIREKIWASGDRNLQVVA